MNARLMRNRWVRLGHMLQGSAILVVLGVMLTALMAQIATHLENAVLLRLSIWLSLGMILGQACVAGTGTFLLSVLWRQWRSNVRDLQPQPLRAGRILRALLLTVLSSWVLVIGMMGMPSSISLMPLVPETVYTFALLLFVLVAFQQRLSVRLQNIETTLYMRTREQYIQL